MARRYYSSTAARTTLASGVDDSTTTFSVTAVSGWPASYPYTLVIDQDTVNEELVEVSARSGTLLTVTRGVDGTSAVAHDAGAAVNHGVSARDFDEPNAFINGTDFVSTDGGSTVEASGAAVTPLTLKGASSQTANLLTVEDSSGQDLFVVNSDGFPRLPNVASDSGDASISQTPGDYPILLEAASTTGYFRPILATQDSGAVNAAILTYDAGGSGKQGLVVATGTVSSLVERMRINGDGAIMIGTTSPGSAGAGDLVVNGGVFLGGSAAANELDDYEEGTWTPTYEPQTNSFTSITYNSSVGGAYIKIGQLVYVQFFLSTDELTVGTASGDVYIGGLPFTGFQGPGLADYGVINLSLAVNFSTDHPCAAQIQRLDTKAILRYRSTANGNLLDLNVSDLTTGSNSGYNWLIGNGMYYAA